MGEFMKKCIILLYAIWGVCYASSNISLLSIYNKTSFIDYTSSSLKYEADLYGIRLGANKKSNKIYNQIDIDISLGLSGRRGHDFFSDRPFYLQLRGAYFSLLNVLTFGNGVDLGLGFGLEYNLEGIVPTNLYGPSLSWNQTLGGTLSLFSRYKVNGQSELSVMISSPVVGVINRPEWTGPISQEIETLAENSYLDVLLNRGELFTVLDYQSINIVLVFKKKLSRDLYFYIEEGINYSNTEIPREYNKFSSKFVFGLNYRVKGY